MYSTMLQPVDTSGVADTEKQEDDKEIIGSSGDDGGVRRVPRRKRPGVPLEDCLQKLHITTVVPLFSQSGRSSTLQERQRDRSRRDSSDCPSRSPTRHSRDPSGYDTSPSSYNQHLVPTASPQTSPTHHPQALSNFLESPPSYLTPESGRPATDPAKSLSSYTETTSVYSQPSRTNTKLTSSYNMSPSICSQFPRSFSQDSSSCSQPPSTYSCSKSPINYSKSTNTSSKSPSNYKFPSSDSTSLSDPGDWSTDTYSQSSPTHCSEDWYEPRGSPVRHDGVGPLCLLKQFMTPTSQLPTRIGTSQMHRQTKTLQPPPSWRRERSRSPVQVKTEEEEVDVYKVMGFTTFHSNKKKWKGLEDGFSCI